MRTVSGRDPRGFDNFVVVFTIIIISGSRLMLIFSNLVPSIKIRCIWKPTFLRLWNPKRNLLSHYPKKRL